MSHKEARRKRKEGFHELSSEAVVSFFKFIVSVLLAGDWGKFGSRLGSGSL